MGENEFRLWASRIGWFATKLEHDHGLDFVCQVHGERAGRQSREMPGNLLTVSVRSTGPAGETVTITRDDAGLLLRTNTPMVFAIVQRGSQQEMGKVALKFPDESFIRELDAFWRSGAERHQLRFSDGVTDLAKIQYNAERLFKESYTDRLMRLRVTLRVEGLLPEPHVEIIHTESGRYAILRSKAISSPVDISQHPNVNDALQDLGLPFRLLPLLGHGLQVVGACSADVPMHRDGSEQAAILRAAVSHPEYSGVVDGQGLDGVPSTMVCADLRSQVEQIRGELLLWNFDKAVSLAAEAERIVDSIPSGDRDGLPEILTLLARAHVRYAEVNRSEAADHGDRARALLVDAEKRLRSGDTERHAEITGLRASLDVIEKGAGQVLTYLQGRTDPYAIRARTALLLNQQKLAEAMAFVDGLEPHEWWCDVAVKAYALNDQIEKAQALVRWAAGLSDRSRYPQCVVRLADGLMARVLAGHTGSANVLPQEITAPERDRLELVAETLRPVLQTIMAAGRPTSGLDMAALQLAWQANYLLQHRPAAATMLSLMNLWTPVPLDVARGVASGFIEASPDLPERLRKDHPGDLDAGILAAVIESDSLGRPMEAFLKAKELLPLADSNEKKEELFRIFHTIWQNIEGPAVAECEAIAGPLVAHSARLQAIFEAGVALRRGDADQAMTILDGQKAEEDPFWLQFRANALLQKGHLAEAVDFLLRAAKLTQHADLLQKTGDVAFKVKRYADAVWCYEQLAGIQPHYLAVRSNLAHIYTFILHDLEKAAVQFRDLHEAEPVNPTHTLNLAICLAQLFRPDESLPLYDELCRLENQPVEAILARAQLHHSLGNPDAALAALKPYRDRLWSDPDFLMAYMTTAHAAGDDAAGNEALMVLNQLRNQGTVKPDALRLVQKDEALEMFKQSRKQTKDRDQHLHAEMLKGRMPWVWAEQASNNAIYWGWRTRTQALEWIGDEPTNRARYCIYSTNGFHAGETERGRRELLPLDCPPAGTRVVADVSALITLHRLGLLDAVAEYFGEVLVPAGYLPTVLEDSRQMVIHQRSRQQSAEQIAKQVTAMRIVPLAEGAETPAAMAIADEYSDSAEHRYRLRDLIGPVHQAGLISDADSAAISRLCTKPSAVVEQHPALGQFQHVLVDLTTLETVAHAGLLDAVVGFYNLRITAAAHREVMQRLEAVAYQEETRRWHMDLWSRLRGNARFKFVPHTVPEAMRGENRNDKDFLPFLAVFIAQETKTPLLADDRVCQAFTLNEMTEVPHTSLGSDVVALTLLAVGRLESDTAAAAICQLMAWRYRFIVPSAELLKHLADQYRGSPPGQALQRVAEYVHDCMRDTGLFGGPERTDLGESMAARTYMAWVAVIAEFIIKVWLDDTFEAGAASRLTQWCLHELLPSSPVVLNGRQRASMSSLTTRLVVSRALVTTGAHPAVPRLAEAMKAIRAGLKLDDDEFLRITMDILNETARANPQR